MYTSHYTPDRFIKMIALLSWVALLSAAVTGCASAPMTKAPDALIENRTGRTLQSVMYRPCGKLSADWTSLRGTGRLSAWEQVKVELPLECSDLKAEFSDGKVAGMQHNIQSRFPFHWVLQ